MFPRLPYHGRIRTMLLGDLPAVLAIEEASFPRPWSEKGFAAILRLAKVYRAYVFEPRHEVVGYLIFDQRDRELHLLNLAVHPGHRGQGHASHMLRELETEAVAFLTSCQAEPGRDAPRGVETVGRMVLEVQESNLAAQLLFRKLGFRATRILRGLYPEAGEDGYRMVKRLHVAPVETLST